MTDHAASPSYSELMIHLVRERQRESEAIRAFAAAIAAGDLEAVAEAFGEVEETGTSRKAMKAVCRIPEVSMAVRERFLRVWTACGDGLRSDVGDDLVLCDALRKLLPPYTGGPLTLY